MHAKWIDYSRAAVFAPQDSPDLVSKAAAVLIEEIEKRTGIRLKTANEYPAEAPCIAVGAGRPEDALPEPLRDAAGALPAPGAEGYRVTAGQNAAIALGADHRGALYGVGMLLRKMRWAPGQLYFPEGLSVSKTPEFGIRGHQLGYRPKTNAYDAWTPQIYDQYIRELALFGANGIEIMPPRTDDAPVSVHMKWDALDMMRRVSASIHSYGLETWIWYPNMAEEYISTESVAAELAERDAVFGAVPHIDHVFIPGGDPGKLAPKPLFGWGEQVSKVLRKYHLNAKMWLSPQTFTPSRRWVDAFYSELAREPEWLDGVVFAPWERDSAAVLRGKTPSRYPIRNYPDITHSLRCQFPVPKLDLPLALTLGRECINPRPCDEKLIHNAYKDNFSGSLSYSEGINDDVNKFVWSDQDFDSSTEVAETLRDYARLFIDFEMADDIAQGFFALERNLRGPLAENGNIDTCLAQWREMERRISGYAKDNYRFEMGLLRAYFDAYQKRRYLYETELEREAVDMLGRCGELGADVGLDNAMEILSRARTRPVAKELKARVMELCDLLYEHIGSQLTVAKHAGAHWGRGAFVECIDIPLNDYRYLSKEIARIKALKNPAEVLASANITAPEDKAGIIFDNDNVCRCEAVRRLLSRTDPGPGGFYDNMGAWSSWHRIKNNDAYLQDPGFLRSSLSTFVLQPPHDREDEYNAPLAWQLQAATFYTNPLEVFYEHLDPDARYLIRLTYVGFFAKHVKLTAAGGACLIHDYLTVDRKHATVEFQLPPEAYRDGRLDLAFHCLDGERGANVAEIWIIKQPGELF